jgi:hypothetical protein
LKNAEKLLPPGTYAVDTDEKLIDGLLFLAHRRIATLLHLPSISSKSTRSEVVTVDPVELQKAWIEM